MFKNELYKAQELNDIIMFTGNCDAIIKLQELIVIILQIVLQ
jgi:hypothetical protein